ncbi:MAG: hypothetical protein SVZ03_13960 [Spirochaetota bacterium]|nr:hypothetical protein [Spirochaetota bacterium]
MKKQIMVLFMIIAICSIMTGCIYHHIKSPFVLNKGTNYQLTTDDFKIIGSVEEKGTIRNILFLFQWGGDGFKILEEKAKEMGGDDIINYTFDVENFGIWIIYNSFTWNARGTVIKYRDKAVK